MKENYTGMPARKRKTILKWCRTQLLWISVRRSAHLTLLCITLLTSHNRYTFRVIPCILQNAMEMWYFGIKCEAIPQQINYLINKQVTLARVRTLLLVTYIISSKIMDSVKLVCICTPTTAQNKTKTITLFSTLHGEQLINFTTLLNSHF